MRTALLVGLIAITSLGCTHTETVRTDTAQFDEIRQHTINERVTVTLMNRQFYRDVRLVQLNPDSASWRDPGGQIITAPTEDLYEVRVVNRSRGRWEGAGLGAVGGALIGLFVGLNSRDDPEDEWFSSTKEEKALFGAVTLGIIGGLFGVVVGGQSGSPQVYRIKPSAPSPSAVSPEDAARERRP